MELRLDTFYTGKESTGGLLSINGKFECFTCEDQPQKIKVPGETRIPAGRYAIQLRTVGGMAGRYFRKFPDHHGMLWLRRVPGFEWIYIHVGNTDAHTDGCILVGQSIAVRESEVTLGYSRKCYESLYPKIVNSIHGGEEVWIDIVR